MDAGEDLAANLKNYEIQLQQVLSALENDSENAEMLQLKFDLEEVIKLTKDLMGPSLPSAGRSSGSSAPHKVVYRTGDRVQAPYSEDGLYYEAVVDDITSDGQCTVVFSHDVLGRGASADGKHPKWSKGISEVCLVSLLKPSQLDNSYKKPSYKPNNANVNNDKKPLSKEALKRKRQKREEKLKEFEQEREKDKMKWQQFAMGKKSGRKKGLASAAGGKKTSIFATPETYDGRVGIGTCGISGKPMTPYAPTASVGASSHQVPLKKKPLTSGFPSKE